jgi:putative transposase
MLKSYRYRLQPTQEQAILIDKHIGSCRFIYNLALETKNYAYVNQRKSITCFDLIKQLPELKEECLWLKEISNAALQQSIIDLDKAYTAFFKGKSKFPKYKKKYCKKQSYRISNCADIKIKPGKIQIPKFKEGIKYIESRPIKGEVKNATVNKTTTGKYYISILAETGQEIPKKKEIKSETAIGIDLGIKHYIVTSENKEYDNPKWLRNSVQRLKVLQKRASKKKKGSNNRKKANKKVALLHEKIANQRKDWLQKLSTELINNHDSICTEDGN